MTSATFRLLLSLAITGAVVAVLAALVVAARSGIPPLRAAVFELDEPFEPPPAARDTR